jgi:hypothetical protein
MDLEGRVVEQIFEPGVLQARPVRIDGTTQVPEAFPRWAEVHEDKEGEAQVLERLKNLGYVE